METLKTPEKANFFDTLSDSPIKSTRESFAICNDIVNEILKKALEDITLAVNVERLSPEKAKPSLLDLNGRKRKRKVAEKLNMKMKNDSKALGE